MTDLNERFRTLDRLAPPDLWDEAERRRPGIRLWGPKRQRLITAGVALVVAAAGIGLAAGTFGGSRQRDATDMVGSPLENGAIAYVSNGEIWSVQPDGSEATKLDIDAPGVVGGPAWSPDGRRLAFDVNSYPPEGAPKGGYYDVYVASADGSDVVRLTYERDARLPAWSPDGSRIAYASQEPDGGSQISAMNADGSDPTQLTSGPAFSVRPAWSPDGSSIAFESVRDRNSDVYVMSADGTDQQQLTDDLAWDGDPVWSPDGAVIAFASERDPPGIYVMNADGSDVRLIEPDDDVANLNIAWSPDGGFLAFSSSRGPGFGRAIYVRELSSGVVTQITDRGPLWGPAWQALLSDASASPVPTATVTPEPSTTAQSPPSVSDPIPIQSSPGAVSALTYGFGSMWVASFDDSMEGWITRLDPGTGEQLARMSTGNVFPTHEIGGGGLAVGSDSVWLAGAARAPGEPGGTHAFVSRIDPGSNDVVDTVDLGLGSAADVVEDPSGMWVLSSSVVDQERGAMIVTRIDPASGAVVETIPLDATYGHHIFAVQGFIVAETNTVHDDAVAGTVLNIIDPSTDSVTRVPLGTYASTAAGDGALWALSGESIASIDPGTGQVLSTWVTLNTGDAAAVGAGGIWFLDPSDGRSVHRFDPITGEVDLSVDIGSGSTPIAMAAAPESVWVLNYEGTLTRIGLTPSP
jgi:Tol biopolymer transport system component